MNISKKISIIFLVIISILSTAFLYNVNAEEYSGSFGNENSGYEFYETENHVIGEYNNEYGGFIFTALNAEMRGRLIIESICEHSYENGDYITLQQLYDYYDVLCCQKGTKLPSEGDTHLKGENGDRLPDSFPYLTEADLGMLLYKDADKREPFGSETYISLSYGYYTEEGEPAIATPKEAYILAEMIKELDGSVFYYDIATDSNGNKIKYEGSLEASESFVVGDEEIYIVEKEYVVTLPDGSNVRVDAVSDGNGGVIYKYREGRYQNHYEKYEGKLTWEDSKTGSGGTYPSFECENSNYNENSGVVTEGDNIVAEGTPIYITGSNLVIREGDEYYRATVEGNNSYIQLAWWTTIAGSLGNPVADTAFSQEADAFEAYILQAAGVGTVGELNHRTETVVDEETGEEKQIENAFDIKYEPEWVTEGEYENPYPVFEDDKQSMLVGPFALDYIEARAQFGGRPEVEFAGITGMELYTDESDEPLEFETDWEIVYLDGERTEEETNDEENPLIYPKSNEKFYIRLFDTENATQITNIKVKFRYMNAAGSWQALRGKYNKGTWIQDSEEHTKPVPVYDEETGEVVDYKDVYSHTNYWLELETVEEGIPSQALALGIRGAKWYNYTELNRKFGINEGKVTIEKELVDANGNTIEDPNREFFTFEVSVSGALNSGTERLRVRAGNKVESQVYYWMDGEATPTYTVEEIAVPDGYEKVELQNASGTINRIGKKNPVIVKAINRMEPNEGYIDVVKIMKETNLPGNTLENEQFAFDVKIEGTFEYNNEKFTDGTKTERIAVKAALNEESAIPVRVGPVVWYGDEAPTYEVTEIKKDGASLVSITPDTGSFADDKTVTVTAVNEQEKEKGSIRIIKTLEGSAGCTREYIESLKFTFEIAVDGYNKETITLTTPKEQNSNDDWVWEGVSSEYVWLYGNNPNYTITEIDVPAGTEFDSGRSQTTGTLVSDEQANYEVRNEIINKAVPETGKIQITKKVEEQVLVNKDFKFAVVVTGNFFEYTSPDGGTTIKSSSDENGRYFTFNNETEKHYGEALQLTTSSAVVLSMSDEYDTTNFVVINATSADGVNGEGAWTSGEFKWYGDKAPTYKVEENLLGEDIASSVEPSEGTLADTEAGADTVKVLAWNRDNTPKGGYLQIIKTLENADKYSVEYVKSLVFKFKIQVDGYDETVVSLQPELVNNSWVWKYLSDRYSWKADQEAPNYTITEIELPTGTEFVSASGPEGSTTGDKSVTGKLKESVSQEILITTDNSFINTLTQKTDELIIEKKITHSSLSGEVFKFKVTLKGSCEFSYKNENGADQNDSIDNSEKTIYVTANGGQKTSPIKVTWYGKDAPTYVVEEEEHEKANVVSIENAAGKLNYEEDGEPTVATFATFTNEPKLVGGQLVISKKAENARENEEFLFEVTIGNDKPYIVSIRPGETYRSDMYKWYITEEAPTYTVKELPKDGVTIEGGDTRTGSLTHEGDATVTVEYKNIYDVNHGTFNVKKVVLDEKLTDPALAASQEFKMKITVEGNFTLEEGGSPRTLAQFDVTLKGGQTFTSPEIYWWGDEAPTVTVEEYSMPLGWQNIGISNNGAPVSKDETLEIVVTNELPVYVTIDLTTKLAGEVWEDEAQDPESKNTEDSVANGLIDGKEFAIPGVEVYVYKVVADGSGNVQERTLATVYKDLGNAEVSQPIITNADGKWEAPRVKIPTVTDEQKVSGWRASYDVEFVYDGQTYEPTKFLATSNGDVSSFLNASTADKDKYAGDSMAIDVNRTDVNAKTETIAGNSPINGEGKTTGTAISGIDGKQSNLYYESKDVMNNYTDGNIKAKSTLITTNEDGSVQDLFKATATTGAAGLTFPFYRDTQEWNGFRLYNQNTSITELGLEQRFWYEAVYGYCLHINLGLVKRPDADLGAAKDLYSATVSVKGESNTQEFNTYRFNTLADINEDYYTRQLQDQMVANYTLGLYSTDYYYRAEMYQANEVNTSNDAYDKLQEMYKNLPNGIDSTEMEVELKYKITLYNESKSYVEVIKSVIDYYDTEFVSNESDIKIELADGTPLSYTINPEEVDKNIVSSRQYKNDEGDIVTEEVTYNQLIIKDLNIELDSGETAEIFVTVKVDKATINGVHDTIIAGKKSNIAEIGSYTTKYSDGTIAGKIDKDSAPDNANIRDYNYVSWFEDDTDSAPVLYLLVKDQGRTIDGKVWEDKAQDGNTVGNGILDSDEAAINGLTTQLVEKVNVDGKDYDFVWPTNQSLNCLGGKSLKDLTGFDSTIETSTFVNEETAEMSYGYYKFEGIPTGNYVVRFLYGNDKTQLEDTLDITYDPVAININTGDNYSGNADILTANYDQDKVGKTAAVYNGQDYKATIYQAGFAQTDSNGYISNRDHDLTNQGLMDARVSDARDSEARRLEIIGKSETLTNTNANVLATANDKAADHTELYRQYYMYADTAKLNLSLENPEENITTVKNIDCGLIERPETAVVLDKEISSIKLITNDQRVIFNAAYDITYDLTNNPNGKVVISKVGNDYLVANVTLNDSSIGTDVLQAINKNENKLSSETEENGGLQNFRFINVDDTIFQGATIELNYQMTALNVGEVDYTSATVEDITTTALANGTTEKVELNNLAKLARDNNTQTDATLEVGKYLGTSYYTGNVGSDTVVTTRVRQVVDYVDNDAVFMPAYNATDNHIWKTTNITELAGNGYDSERLLDRTVLSEYEMIDKNGKAYIANEKNNIILSVDTIDSTSGIGNSGFEAKLLPYSNNPDSYKSQIALTVSKTVSAQDKDLTYDNLAEIVKIQNTVGRRDMLAIPGNANPKLGEFEQSIKERDTSATELVTFTPPTGTETEVTITAQVLMVTLAALAIIAVGIVVIKKKVL